jgi:hypothetical protein
LSEACCSCVGVFEKIVSKRARSHTDKKKVDGWRIWIVYEELEITRFTCVLSVSV